MTELTPGLIYGDVNLSGSKITSLGNGSDMADAVNISQLQSYVPAGGIVAQDATGNFQGTTEVAIQAAIDYLYGLGGGQVLIRAGTYNISNQIIVKQGVNMMGVGATTILNGVGLATAIMGAPAATTISDMLIFSMTFQGTATAGIEMTPINCQFRDLGFGVTGDHGLILTDDGVNVRQFNTIQACNFGESMVNFIWCYPLQYNTFIRSCFFNGNPGVSPTHCIFVEGFAPTVTQCIVNFATMAGIYTTSLAIILNNTFVGSPVCIHVNALADGPFGVPNTLIATANTAISLGIPTDYFVKSDVSLGVAMSLLISSASLISVANVLNITGAGTHNVHVDGLTSIVGVVWDAVGIIDPTSVVSLPATPLAAEPSGPILGMIYLDDGTNTGTGIMGYRRYNGSIWQNIAQ